MKRFAPVLWMALGAAAMYGWVYLDVVSRAKESYLKGEQFLDWASHPEKKKAALDAWFESEKAKLKPTEPRYQESLDALTFDRDQQLQESSLKYAYQWTKDTYELFSPPESVWVKKAREKAPQILALWKQELDQKKIPYTDLMLE